MRDTVVIKKLLISTHIGVPDEERENAQELCINVEMVVKTPFFELADEIDQGVDYYQVSKAIQRVASSRPRKLIETLAEDIAAMILADFPVASLRLEVEKYILTDAQYVAVRIHRP